MTIFSRLCLLIASVITVTVSAVALAEQEQMSPSPVPVISDHQVDHFDELKVNPNLQLSEVLEKAYARAPMHAALLSRDYMVSARSRVANAMLPSTPAVSVLHQNDAIGSGRGERD